MFSQRVVLVLLAIVAMAAAFRSPMMASRGKLQHHVVIDVLAFPIFLFTYMLTYQLLTSL